MLHLLFVDGTGLGLDIRGASRFLAHATLGYSIEDVQALTETGFEAWIDNQITLPASNYTDKVHYIIDEWRADCIATLGDSICEENFNKRLPMWRSAWWDNTMKGEDQLRQRVAMALSEIIVLSDNSQLRNFPDGLAAFYDVLSTNAFGNYETLLTEVTYNLSMGFYLSHLNNPPTSTAENIRPDENYAREIMQLFTIGLYELNNDGTRKLDADGLWIPTYDNDDIKGLSKVFTGISGSKRRDNDPREPVFGRFQGYYDHTAPMKVYEDFHEKGEKKIVGGNIIPAGQSGEEDIQQAINILFNHDNVGPFITTRLIQRLVKSNPSRAYIDRVATVFNNNGSGVRGDLKAVVKTILLDEEAYECYWIDNMENGMLRSPMLRYTQLLKGLKAVMGADIFYNFGVDFQEFTGQHVLSAQTVFNFYRPDYEPNSDFSYYNMVGPEYQILNSSTSSNYVNFMLNAIMRDYTSERFNRPNQRHYLVDQRTTPYDRDKAKYRASLTGELWLELGYSPAELVDYLDILMTNGSLSDDAKSRIIESISDTVLFTPVDAAHYALFLIMIDPDFVIMK